uniref:Uncharacterized protein n=1 Tax=Bracon brevicornis TaxID=1563983 RepID=A0A6V7JNL0_9HYME
MSRQQEIEEEETRRSEEELLNSRKLEPIYDETPLIVRPGGKKPKLPKVSVAIDATPATRTESILNQIPIELAKDMEAMGENAEDMTEYESNYVEPQMTPQVVVIEHHHSRSDPLPMNNVIKGIKPNFSTLSRTYESDSGSASSLYAKINPKLKSRLPQFAQRELLEEEISNDTCDGLETPKPNDDDIYSRIPKMTTFGVTNGDINVTSCDPIKEREVISPEEALKTIKRRNYPKVLPDIEKRRSLPAPNTLYSCKPLGNTLKDHRQGPHPSCKDEGPPVPPPRLFGTSKSLDLPEEDETPVTTNLHVGPLLKRQDSLGKNHSDTSIIDSIARVAMDAQQVLSDHRDEYMEMTPNAKCPVHGKPSIFSNQGNASSTSRSVDDLDRKIDSSDWYPKPSSTENSKSLSKMSLPNVSVGNPNWYRTMRKAKDIANPYVQYGEPENDKMYHQIIPKEPRIVITPRKDIPGKDPTLPQLIVNPNPLVPSSTAQQSHLDNLSRSNEVYSTPKGSVTPSESSLNVTRFDRHEPQIVIAPAAGTLKQPKIIIKPTTNSHRYRERNIPKVSAIPSPEAIPNFQFNEKDSKTVDELKSSDKPPIKKKPNVSRIPSFTKRREEHSTSDQTNPGIYPEKVEIVQRVNDSTSTEVSIPLCSDNKSSIPTLRKDSVTPEFGNNAGNLDSNTNTIKRKPVGKK